jgi:uncharacterized protein involved in exopolysaccharide biosynthesis
MSDEQKFYQSEGLVAFLYRNVKLLVIIGVVAAILSAIASFLIQEKYKSSVVMFPTTTNSISKALLDVNSSSKKDVLEFGEEEQAEQLLQILNSDEIRNRVISKFDLRKHYGLKPDEKYVNTKLQKEFEDNVTFTRTEYMAVEIEVLDPNPDTAALIANYIAELVDTLKNNMRKKMAKEALQIVEHEYLSFKEYVQSIEDSLTRLRMLGVNDYESQVERLTEQLGIAIVKNNQSAVKQLQERLDKLSKYGGAYVALRDLLEHETEKLSHLRTRYEQAKVDATANLENKFIVNKAYPAEKKSYPIRWLIVFVSVIAAELFAIILILIKDSINRIDKK